MEQPRLFGEAPASNVRSQQDPLVKPLTTAIWTEDKAKLIARYLYYFVLVTKHGTYIDGFAGPQRPDSVNAWSANLVLANEPRWLKNFYLFDANSQQIAELERLRDSQPPRRPSDPQRRIEVFRGDFNVRVHDLLSSQIIPQREAAFCLLDQRTFECRWSTVQALAAYKREPCKIELFYFLPIGWLDRAICAQRDLSVIDAWWGRTDWGNFRELSSRARAETFCKRFRQELGYASVKPWPIFEHQDSQRIMYFMIHATDHPEAPTLMSRAYRFIVTSPDIASQPSLFSDQLDLATGPPELPLIA